jgi:hypothetical protein
MPHLADTEAAAVELTLVDQGREHALVDVPPGTAALSAAARASLAFEVIHRTVSVIGEENGWPAGALDRVRERCIAEDLQFSWAGPWKTSRNRKLKARAVFRLHPDGYGRAMVDVESIDAASVKVSPTAYLAFSTAEGFARSAGTLRWAADSSSLSFTPWSGVFGQELDTHTIGIGELVDGISFLDTAHNYFAYSPTPHTVQVTRERLDLPEIVIVGGGPTNLVSDEYEFALNEYLNRLNDAWTPWWEQVDAGRLQVIYRFREGKAKVTLRRTNRKVSAFIQRPPGFEVQSGGDPRMSAWRDVDALAEKLRSTFKEPPAPKQWSEPPQPR